MRAHTIEELESRIFGAFPELRQAPSSSPSVPSILACDAFLGDAPIQLKALMTKKASAERLKNGFARLFVERPDQASEHPTLLIIVDESVGSRALAEVRSFIERCLPTAHWGFLGQKDRVLEAPNLGYSLHEQSSADNSPLPSRAPARSRYFSDLNRWLLKLFLMQDVREACDNIDENDWPPRDPKGLSVLTGVAYETARGFVVASSKRGFLIRRPPPLRLQNLPSLLQSWLEDEQNWAQEDAPFRHLSGRPPRLAPLESNSIAYALGGLAAASEHQIQHASSPGPRLIHVANHLDELARAWDLVPSSLADAHVILRKPAHPQSVFRSLLHRPNRLPLVDVWQSALDVVQTPPRGREQAQFVLNLLARQAHR